MRHQPKFRGRHNISCSYACPVHRCLSDVRPCASGSSAAGVCRRTANGIPNVSILGDKFSGQLSSSIAGTAGMPIQGTACHGSCKAGIDAQTLEGGFEGVARAASRYYAGSAPGSRKLAVRLGYSEPGQRSFPSSRCPWLTRRFVDPTAVFLYVGPSR